MFYYCIFDWGNLYHVARVEASDTLEAIEKMNLTDDILRAYRREFYVDDEMPDYLFTEIKESRIMSPQKLSRLIKRAYYQDKIQATYAWIAEYEKELEKWK